MCCLLHFFFRNFQGFGHSQDHWLQCDQEQGPVRRECVDVGLRRDDRRQEADGDHQRNSRQRQIFTQSPAACQRCKMKTEKKKRNLFNWIKLYQMLKLDRGTRPTRRFERCRYSGVCRTSSVYQQIMRSNGGEHQIFRNRSVSHQSKWESMLN